MHTIRKSKLQQMLKLNLRNPCDKFCHSLVMSHILNISITLIPSHFAAEQGAVFSLICNLPPSEPPIPIPCVALPQLENQASSPKVEYSPDDWCHFQVSYRSPTPPPSLTPSHQIRLVPPHHYILLQMLSNFYVHTFLIHRQQCPQVIMFFLAVQNSSIGDLVPCLVCLSVTTNIVSNNQSLHNTKE